MKKLLMLLGFLFFRSSLVYADNIFCGTTAPGDTNVFPEMQPIINEQTSVENIKFFLDNTNSKNIDGCFLSGYKQRETDNVILIIAVQAVMSQDKLFSLLRKMPTPQEGISLEENQSNPEIS